MYCLNFDPLNFSTDFFIAISVSCCTRSAKEVPWFCKKKKKDNVRAAFWKHIETRSNWSNEYRDNRRNPYIFRSVLTDDIA